MPTTAAGDDVACAAGARRLQWAGRIVAAAIALAAAAALVAIAASAKRWRQTGEALHFHTVSRGELLIRLTERGNLESQENLEVECEVDDAPGDGIAGTTILWIAPNGSSVKKGDLIVELDSASHEKRVDDQFLETERERSEQLRSTVLYENRKTQNETLLANAELRVKLTELNLQSFEDNEGGIFELGLQDLEMQIQVAHAQKLISETDLMGNEMLYNLGYSSKSDIAQSRLALLRAFRSLARAISQREVRVQYDYHKQKLQYVGAVESAKRFLVQVKRNNEWILARFLYAKHAADRRLERDEQRLERYREQIGKCKIYAPQDGMVVYASGVKEGEAVYQRRTILTLPDLSKMQVKATVHESGVRQVKPGLPATVHIEARPGVRYQGSVKAVAVLPDQSGWLNSDVKVYETIITIDEEVERLHPGMTAVVEIDVDHLHDVLLAPVEAIVEIDGDDWCYVDGGGQLERRMVTVGGANDRFVEIQTGLNEGDRVVLNPMAAPDEARRRERTISADQELEDVLR